MNSSLIKRISNKREWKVMEARAEALPRDYRIVYRATKSYMFKFATGDGMDIVSI